MAGAVLNRALRSAIWASLNGLGSTLKPSGSGKNPAPSRAGAILGAAFSLPTPAYIQLADLLRGRIAAGEWSSGPLPSNRTLRETYDVGEYVVTRAIRLLEDEGLVFTVPRRGVYVRRKGA
jgi:GntR family transcriptional regulator